jgi:hypothetical protein
VEGGGGEKSEEVHDHRRVGKAPAVVMKSDVWVQVGRVGLAEKLIRYLSEQTHRLDSRRQLPRQSHKLTIPQPLGL